MKKLAISLSFLLFATVLVAQEQPQQDYNHWSIEGQFGLNKPNDAFTPSYRSNLDLWTGDIGIRYMINELFGLKADFGYDSFEDGGGQEFSNKIIRTSLQGVVNAGTLLGFRDWTNRFNLLVHAGLGYGALGTNMPEKSADNYGFIKYGITPQMRLGNHWALSLDASLAHNFGQHLAFDGTSNEGVNGTGFDGYNLYTTAGITYYFGGKGSRGNVHADWAKRENRDDYARNELDIMADRIAALEDKVDEKNSEYDAFLEDSNNNGIPDKLEQPLDDRYKSTDKGGNLADVINKGTSVHFDLDKANPQLNSAEAINRVVTYLKDNPSANIEVIGYADEIGGKSDYNQKLSEKRAERVKEIMAKVGISENRISTSGKGVDDSVDKGSKEARQVARRVIFKLK